MLRFLFDIFLVFLINCIINFWNLWSSMHQKLEGIWWILFLCYIIDPPDPPCGCDGYRVWLFIVHALNWKKEGLVDSWHNFLHDRATDLSMKAFMYLYLRDNPPSTQVVWCGVWRPHWPGILPHQSTIGSVLIREEGWPSHLWPKEERDVQCSQH